MLQISLTFAPTPKQNVILTKFQSLAGLEVIILTTSSAASDGNFIKMMTFQFQCIGLIRSGNYA